MDTDGYLRALDGQMDAVTAACTACGRCVEVCPMPGVAGIEAGDPAAVARGVRDALASGAADGASRRWAEACTGSGHCIDACPEGINPRQMLALARLRLSLEESSRDERRRRGAAPFRAMSRGVRILSRLQLDGDQLARLGLTQRHEAVADPEVVFYTGCNILKTPHIALLCLDVMDALGVRYQVRGGPGECCGVYQVRGADVENAARVSASTFGKLSSSGAQVLSWCPSCQVTFTDFALPVHERTAGHSPFHMSPFALFLHERLDALEALMTHPVRKRIALHEHAGFPGVNEAVRQVLSRIPGVTLVELDRQPLGYMCTSLSPVPAARRDLHGAELEAAAAAGVDALVGIYHACHRDLCAHQRDWPFQVVNFTEIIGESMGLHREDLFKRLKLMQDADAILAETSGRAARNGLDPGEVREVIVGDLLGEQSRPLGRAG